MHYRRAGWTVIGCATLTLMGCASQHELGADAAPRADLGADSSAPDGARPGVFDVGVRDIAGCDVGSATTCDAFTTRVWGIPDFSPSDSEHRVGVGLTSDCLRVGFRVAADARDRVEAIWDDASCGTLCVIVAHDDYICGVDGFGELTESQFVEICRLQRVFADEELFCFVLGD